MTPRLTTNDELRAAKRNWAIAEQAKERQAIINPIVDQLIEKAEQAQRAAMAIGDGAGITKLLERSEHIARTGAFLDAIDIIRKGGKK
jgi:hypothetical protein